MASPKDTMVSFDDARVQRVGLWVEFEGCEGREMSRLTPPNNVLWARDGSVAGYVCIANLKTFRRRRTLQACTNRGVQSQRLIDDCIQMLKILQWLVQYVAVGTNMRCDFLSD